ncbi:hypothetical protein ACHAWF_009619 [Thalassiosira exigua]
MGKKGKRSAKKNGGGGGGGGDGGAAPSFNAHREWEEVLRKHAHSAAVADLDALEPGGPSWTRYLEAFGLSCRDAVPQLSMRHESEGVARTYRNAQRRDDPIARALVATCGDRAAKLITDFVREEMATSLARYGRPLPSKADIMAEHECRVFHFRRQRAENRAKGWVQARNTSSSVRKDAGLDDASAKVDWSDLKRIFVRDLKLYDSHEGAYLEGKLLVDPFTPMVGTTTIMEDSNGDVILIALYNFLPEGLHGDESVPVASAKIPKGSTVRILAPFVKVFRDGSRGIRIDNPNEITMISDANSGLKDEGSILSRAKEVGNQLVDTKKYLSASEAYIGGIRAAEMVPTILSNRSQTYAMLGDWKRSLADAAASLTMRPGNKKTWDRYRRAAEQMLDGVELDGNEMAWIVANVLPLDADLRASEAETKGKDLAGLKRAGNAAFQQKKYAKAAEFYTSSLLSFGETERALLANWALCCLQSEANLDAMAASAASMRICPEAKTILRLARAILSLGDPMLCINVLENTDKTILKGNAICAERNEILDSANAFLLMEDDTADHVAVMTKVCMSKYHPSWRGNIETFDAGSKGRGVRATADLAAGEILLIEHALAAAETEGLDGDKDIVITMGKSKVKDTSQSYLRQALVLRSQRESVLSRITDCLFDGTNKRPVVPFDTLIPNLSSCPAFLPSHHEYTSDEDRVVLNSERVGAIAKVNSHGKGGVFNQSSPSERYTGAKHTALFPATSMFNHSAKPPCDQDFIGNVCVVFTKTAVKKGDELSLCYHPDENLVRRNWLGLSS